MANTSTKKSRPIEIVKVCPGCLAYREYPYRNRSLHPDGRMWTCFNIEPRYIAYIDDELVTSDGGYFYHKTMKAAKVAAMASQREQFTESGGDAALENLSCVMNEVRPDTAVSDS